MATGDIQIKTTERSAEKATPHLTSIYHPLPLTPMTT